MSPTPFSPKTVETLLVKSHRRCCLCHNYCGNRMIIHHIDQKGGNDEENGIPLCLNCHAEVNSYNPNHPIGRKFSPSELKEHKKQWFKQVQKLTFTNDKEMDEGIDEFPPYSGYHNIMSVIIEKYSKYFYHKQNIPLIKDKILFGVSFLIFESPLAYGVIGNAPFLNNNIYLIMLSCILGIFSLSFVYYIEETRCPTCNSAGGKTIFDSKLISEKVRETKKQIITNKTYNVAYKCRVCGVITTKTQKYKDVEDKNAKDDNSDN